MLFFGYFDSNTAEFSCARQRRSTASSRRVTDLAISEIAWCHLAAKRLPIILGRSPPSVVSFPLKFSASLTSILLQFLCQNYMQLSFNFSSCIRNWSFSIFGQEAYARMKNRTTEHDRGIGPLQSHYCLKRFRSARHHYAWDAQSR